MNYKTVTLEDGLEYFIVDTIKDGNSVYYYLGNIKDTDDFCVRKVNDDNLDMLLGLDSDEEFDRAMFLFTKKNNVGIK